MNPMTKADLCEYDLPRYEEGKALAEKLCKSLNCMGGEEATALGFADGMTQEHRTLQQAAFRLVMSWIRNHAEAKYGCDLRNEASVKLAKRIVEAVGDDAHLPYV